MTPLYFCMTMDCERILAESPPGGPPDWDFSRKAIEGFHAILSQEGQKATFFIVPETAAKHAPLWLSMDPEAFELGLHLHPQSFGDLRHGEYLGAYPAAEQRALLEQAAAVWRDALGRSPLTFRPGNLSASDATYGILAALGFTHGSVSAPERRAPAFRAVWQGADPYVHRAHAGFRLIPGDLEFVEIPVTEDVSRSWGTEPGFSGSARTRVEWGNAGFSAPVELRVEWGDADFHRTTVQNVLHRAVADAPPLITLVSLTHNHQDYFSPNSPRVSALRGIVRAARETADELGLTLIPATLEQIREAFLAVEGGPTAGPGAGETP